MSTVFESVVTIGGLSKRVKILNEASFCFSSVEERNTWYNLMEIRINDEKQRENPKRTSVCINYKCGKKLSVRKFFLFLKTR